MRVGIAFNLLPSDPSELIPDGPDDAFEEYDKPGTIHAVADFLKGLGHDVTLLGDGVPLVRRLLESPPDLVWNMAEGQGIGRSREARVPALLEMFGIPYVGSDPLTMAVTLDKDVAKRIVTSDGAIEVPRGAAIEPQSTLDAFRDRVEPLFTPAGRPLILKPSFEGSSKGIRGRCLAQDLHEAWTTYRDLAGVYRQTIMVEQFIAGDEVTVGVVGNGSDVEVLGVLRVIPKIVDPLFVYSLEMKRDWENRVDYEVPARLNPQVMDTVISAARRTYSLLGCRDLARIDFRISDDVPYFLEANPLPGLAPESSDLVILARGMGLSHSDLLGKIFDAVLRRVGLRDNHR